MSVGDADTLGLSSALRCCHSRVSAITRVTARKHGVMVLTIEAHKCPNTHVQAEHLMAMSCRVFEDMTPPILHPTLSGSSGSFGGNMESTSLARPQQRGHEDTLWSPQFFSAATHESKRFTADSATADPGDYRRPGGVRIRGPGVPTLRFSSRLLFVHNVVFFGAGIPARSQRMLPGIVGEVAGLSSNTKWAFRQHWKEYGVNLRLQCVHDCRR